MSRKRIVIIEDERDMADLVAKRLQREGYHVEAVYDGRAGLELIRAQPPDLAIVDIMLPRLSGTDLVSEMRQDPRTAGVPVIMMTAKGTESDIVGGLRLGADDYVTKPFSLSVMVARVGAVLRRTAAAAPAAGTIRAGPITIDANRHVVEVNGKAVPLTLTEFRLLVALAAARGRVLTRSQLIDHAMGVNVVVTDRTIDVHMTSLRRKLGGARAAVRTVRGVGYRLSLEEDSHARPSQ
ncbi:MAG: response regulator transcription factor [Planctomycetota bacterium]|nr:response regulator transcription factor [Planctomycetota bacterium]